VRTKSQEPGIKIGKTTIAILAPGFRF